MTNESTMRRASGLACLLAVAVLATAAPAAASDTAYARVVQLYAEDDGDAALRMDGVSGACSNGDYFKVSVDATGWNGMYGLLMAAYLNGVRVSLTYHCQQSTAWVTRVKTERL